MAKMLAELGILNYISLHPARVVAPGTPKPVMRYTEITDRCTKITDRSTEIMGRPHQDH